MSGDCFPVAADLVAYGADLKLGLRPGDEVRVVHGLPVGRGAENEGKRYWHAWVEVTRRILVPDEVRQAHPELLTLFSEAGELETVTVIDRANGRDLALPVELYYAMGALSDECVWRFTVLEARREMGTRGHFGPWIDDWESYEEVGQ